MKKFVFFTLLVLITAGGYYGWKMMKGDAGCCGWGGDNVDPWSSYAPPEQESGADVSTDETA